MNNYNIAVIGSGIIGMTCALQLSKLNNVNVTLFGKEPQYSKHKTTAILQTSFNIFQDLISLKENDTIISALIKFKIIDQLSSAEKILEFYSSEINLNAFAYNVSDTDLSTLLIKEILNTDNIKREKILVKKILQDIDNIIIETSGKKETFDLIIGADGRNSITRDFANIEYTRKKYKENILITTIDHKEDHNGTSYEIHKNGSLLTSVPLSSKKSAIVYINDKKNIESFIENKKLQNIFNTTLSPYLGRVEMNSNFSELPSEVVIADKLAKNRVILVGESAHVFPPLGAQGLNLGIRDIKELYSLLAQNRDINPGSKVIMNKYHEQRWLDVYKRHKSVNLLYNSMMENKTRYKILRNIGLQSLNKSKILRKILLSQGMVIEKK